MGQVIHQGNVLEIKPLSDKYHHMLQATSMDGSWHVVTLQPLDQLPEFDQDLPTATGNASHEVKDIAVKKRASGDDLLTIETAVFLDPTAYRNYLKYFRGDTNKVTSMLLAFINGIQAIYHFKSLGRRKIDFTIVHMELMTKTPFDEKYGEREGLLREFCKYQVTIGPDRRIP